MRTGRTVAVEDPARPRSAESGSQRTDEELLIDYRRTGDSRSFAELVQRYERELFNYLRRYLGDARNAEDVFQASFLLVHLKCQQFEEGRRFRPWLYAVATNAAIDFQRRERRHRAVSLDRAGVRPPRRDMTRLADVLEGADLDPSVLVSRREHSSLVQEALAGLTDQMRNVVHLVYYQGLKYREAAEILNVPVGTVKSRLHAAIQKLNEFWNRTHAGTDPQ
jgi:RNA polymerase sigma-70 factor (ECF subfamily)